MSPLARALMALISSYRRWVSPALGPHCRYHPTCSEYAAGAIAGFGAIRGGVMSVRRVARCHPFAPGGIDPVPDRKSA